MAHVIEPASSGRAKCRSCDQPIAKGELRFGERQPNAFGEGEMTLWFHLPCAAYARPEPFLETRLEGPAAARSSAARGLAAAARFGIEHRRVPRAARRRARRVRPRALPQLPRAHRQGRVALGARVLRGVSLQSAAATFTLAARANTSRPWTCSTVFATSVRSSASRSLWKCSRARDRQRNPSELHSAGDTAQRNGARRGADVLARLRDRPPAIWYRGERVNDVTAHPAFSGGVATLGRLYDLQWQHADRLPVRLARRRPTRSARSFMMPRRARSSRASVARWSSGSATRSA